MGSFLILCESALFHTVSVYREGLVLSSSVNAVSDTELSNRSHSDERICILSRRRILRALKSSNLKSFRNQGRGALYIPVATVKNALSRRRTSCIVSSSILTRWQQYSNMARINVRYIFLLSLGQKPLAFSPILFRISCLVRAF